MLRAKEATEVTLTTSHIHVRMGVKITATRFEHDDGVLQDGPTEACIQMPYIMVGSPHQNPLFVDIICLPLIVALAEKVTRHCFTYNKLLMQ